MDKIRTDIGQRDEHKGAFVQARVRDDQRRGFQDQFIIKQDVEIDQARAVAEARGAAQPGFEFFQKREQVGGREFGFGANGHV